MGEIAANASPSSNASTAVRVGLACGYPKGRCSFTKSQIVCTQDQPGRSELGQAF